MITVKDLEMAYGIAGRTIRKRCLDMGLPKRGGAYVLSDEEVMVLGLGEIKPRRRGDKRAGV